MPYFTNRGIVALPSGEDAKTTAWVNAVVSAGGTVSATQRTRVDTLLAGLRTDNLLSSIDRLWLHGGESVSQQATIDIINLGVATVHGGLTLDAFGYVGDATPGTYLDTGFNPATNGVAYTLNSSGIGSYAQSSYTGGTFSAIGSRTASDFAELIGISPDLYILLNDGGDLHFTTSSAGFCVGTRTASNAKALYKNGSQIASNADSSTAIPSLNLYALARNNQGSDDLQLPNTVKISATVITGGLDATKNSNLSSRLNTYMTAWGINVY